MFSLKCVREYTSKPLFMGRRQTLEEARRSLKGHGADHIVVVDRAQPVGLLSRHDLAIVDALSDLPADALTIEEAMTSPVYVVAGATPVLQVIAAMGRDGRQAALVTEDDAVNGVFTAMEGIRIIAMALEHRGRKPPKAVQPRSDRLSALER